jgi:hypothetical protein
MSFTAVHRFSFIVIIFFFIHLIHGSPIERRSAAVPVVKGYKWLGHVKSSTTNVIRDLGFPGQIDDIQLLTYGDTLFRSTKQPNSFLGMVTNSVALATDNPLVVVDKNLGTNGWPVHFVPVLAKYGEDAAVDAMGITNVIPTTLGNAVVFFLKNHRPNGKNTLIGAGVASVVMKNGVPQATRLAEYWWNGATEAHYGDVAVMRNGSYIYAYGNSPTGDGYIYVNRVYYTKATRLEAYQYWNGTDWQNDRLYNPTKKAAIFWKFGQGSMSWNSHLNKFLFVYSGESLNNHRESNIKTDFQRYLGKQSDQLGHLRLSARPVDFDVECARYGSTVK